MLKPINLTYNRMLLLSLLILASYLFSCTSQPRSEENTEEQQPEVKEKAYQDAWARAGAKFDENETELKQKEEEEKKTYFINALQGTWEYKGRIHVYGSQYANISCRLVVDGNKITLYGNDGKSDQGLIKDIDFYEGVISFGEHSTVEFDILGEEFNQYFYLWFERKSRGTGKPFRHISNEPSYRSTNSNSHSSISGYGSDSRLMSNFNRLNEEGRKLLDEIGQYYYSGQAGPWLITDVYRLKQIADEKIDLARQMGDRDLESLCRQQKAQTLAALRQMGF